MIAYLTENLWLFWLVLTTVCLTLELASGDFYITCFGIGAIVALIVSLFAAPFWLQVVVFAVFSVLSIFYLRPSLVALLNHDADRRVSNAAAIIGRTGEVTEAIQAGGYGRVKLDGDDWKAQSDCAADLEIGTKVRIVGRESIIIKVVPEI